MKVSIITIAYNAAETIEETIQSVCSQDFPDLEYVVVDGASTDGTIAIINKYRGQIHHFVSEPDQGIYDAMNKGISMATGDLIGILNADDTYSHQSVVAKVVAKMNETNADACYADLQYVSRGTEAKVIRYWKAGVCTAQSFYKGWMPPHPTFFLKKEKYNQFGNYNTDLKSSADYELMLRMMLKNKISTAYLPEVVVKMKVGGQSNVSLKNRVKANREDRKAWRLNGLKPGAFTLIRKPLGKITQFFRR